MKFFTILFSAFFLSVSSALPQETDNLRLFAYKPKCSDFILGYSINLMAEGRLVGHPEKSCNLNVDYSACSTTLCRVGVQLREWQACVAEKATQKLETSCNWFSETAAIDTPVGTGADTPVGSGIVAERCFSEAVSALRERMTILLSPSISPEEQQIALSFNDQLIAALKSHNGMTSNIVCGQHMKVAESFPDLPTAKALRIALLSSHAAVENRSTLFAIMRLAFETSRANIKVPREGWYSCFVDLEVSFFVFRSNLDDLLVNFERTCALFLVEETQTEALQDFGEMKS